MMRTNLRSPLVSVEIDDEGADVLVVTNGWPREDDPTYCVFVLRQVESLRMAGVRCTVIFVRGYRSRVAYLAAAARLFALSFRRRYSLVHAHGGEAALAARFYVRAPLVVSYLGSDLNGAARADGSIGLLARLKRELIRQHARLATATITKSAAMATALPRRVQSRNSVVPNGVDDTAFAPMPRARARAQLGWPDGRVVAFVADPSVPGKRFGLAEDAVAIARQELPDLRLEVVYGVDPDTIPLVMNAADCLVLPSVSEGSPNVVKEALMCGLPVVATDAGDVRELLHGVEPSFVVAADPEPIAAAIVTCVRTPQRSNGRGRSRHLTAERAAGRVLQVFERVGSQHAAVPVRSGS